MKNILETSIIVPLSIALGFISDCFPKVKFTSYPLLSVLCLDLILKLEIDDMLANASPLKPNDLIFC